MRELIIIEEDDEGGIRNLRRTHIKNPIIDGWFCPYCGKRVYSMEVHSCNQPYCEADRSELL